MTSNINAICKIVIKVILFSILGFFPIFIRIWDNAGDVGWWSAIHKFEFIVTLYFSAVFVLTAIIVFSRWRRNLRSRRI